MTEPLYVGGAAGYDELFARVTHSFMPALLASFIRRSDRFGFHTRAIGRVDGAAFRDG